MRSTHWAGEEDLAPVIKRLNRIYGHAKQTIPTRVLGRREFMLDPRGVALAVVHVFNLLRRPRDSGESANGIEMITTI